MENLHLKNLTKEVLFEKVHQPRLIAFFNKTNLTRYNIEQLFEMFNIKPSKDIITAIYEIHRNEYSNKIALVNATLNYIIKLTEKPKTTYYVDHSVDNIIFLRELFYILSESFILKEYLETEQIKTLNENIKKLIKPNKITAYNKILTFVIPTISSVSTGATIVANTKFKDILKEDLKQNNYYNITKKEYNKEDIESIENKLREDFKKYILKFDNTITALEIFLLNINKIPNELQELELIEITN